MHGPPVVPAAAVVTAPSTGSRPRSRPSWYRPRGRTALGGGELALDCSSARHRRRARRRPAGDRWPRRGPDQPAPGRGMARIAPDRADVLRSLREGLARRRRHTRGKPVARDGGLSGRALPWLVASRSPRGGGDESRGRTGHRARPAAMPDPALARRLELPTATLLVVATRSWWRRCRTTGASTSCSGASIIRPRLRLPGRPPLASALALVVAASFVHARHVETGRRLQDVFTAGKVALLALVTDACQRRRRFPPASARTPPARSSTPPSRRGSRSGSCWCRTRIRAETPRRTWRATCTIPPAPSPAPCWAGRRWSPCSTSPPTPSSSPPPRRARWSSPGSASGGGRERGLRPGGRTGAGRDDRPRPRLHGRRARHDGPARGRGHGGRPPACSSCGCASRPSLVPIAPGGTRSRLLFVAVSAWMVVQTGA